MLEVRVHLYGLLRERLPQAWKGRGALELPAGSTVADLLAHLEIQSQVVVAVNDDEVLDRDHVLRPGDEVAVYAAISGGRACATRAVDRATAGQAGTGFPGR